MFAEMNRAAVERARGAELAEAAEALLAEARIDSIDVAHAVQLATASALLALYWEVRQHRPAGGTAPLVHCQPYARGVASDPGA